MRIAVFGGTGFVGYQLVKFLLKKEFELSLLVRPASKNNVDFEGEVKIVSGSVDSEKAIKETIKDSDCVIYNIGILEESPKEGATFEELQYQSAKRIIDLSRARSIKKFILMSANGIDQNCTKYQKTKLAAETHLINSGLTYTIFRPSVIFGDPHGRMEFATQLFNEMIKTPIPAVNFISSLSPKLNSVKLSPVHIEDVIEAFFVALKSDATNNQLYALGGPDELTWGRIIELLMSATNKKKIMIPVPTIIMKITTLLFSWLKILPVSYDQIVMLEQGNTADPKTLTELIGRELKNFNPETLKYLNN